MTEERGITAKRKGTSRQNGGTRWKRTRSRQEGLVTAEGNNVVEGNLWAEVEKGRECHGNITAERRLDGREYGREKWRREGNVMTEENVGAAAWQKGTSGSEHGGRECACGGREVKADRRECHSVTAEGNVTARGKETEGTSRRK